MKKQLPDSLREAQSRAGRLAWESRVRKAQEAEANRLIEEAKAAAAEPEPVPPTEAPAPAPSETITPAEQSNNSPQ